MVYQTLKGMPHGELIARTAHAEVYAWDKHQILKLYLKDRQAELSTDRSRAKGAAQVGLPVPAVGKQIEVEGRMGLLFERVDGPTMGQYIGEQPGRAALCARTLAELHADIHASGKWKGLPDQRLGLESGIRFGATIRLPDHLRTAALKALKAMPDADQLCHGDFHPNNVLMGSDGPVIIDWGSASIGSPLADVARTSVAMLQGKPWRGLRRPYLERYSQLRPIDEAELDAWMPIVAALRYSQNPDPRDDLLPRLLRHNLLPTVTNREWQDLKDEMAAAAPSSDPPPRAADAPLSRETARWTALAGIISLGQW